MATIKSLNYYTLFDICAYLNRNDFVSFTSTSKYFHGLQLFETKWKSLCWEDFKLRYKHPDQSYLDLYKDCMEAKRSGGSKRLPCPHLYAASQLPLLNSKDSIGGEHQQQQENAKKWTQRFPPQRCERCKAAGPQKLFLCLARNCHRAFCERHAREHAKLNESDETAMHLISYKLNMSELFCQQCIDWIGGHSAGLSERYQASLITNYWFSTLAQAYKRARLEGQTEGSSPMMATLNNTTMDSSPRGSRREPTALFDTNDFEGVHAANNIEDGADENEWSENDDNNAGTFLEDMKLLESTELLELKEIRQKERRLRIDETFPYPAINCKDYCFISAEWMRTWELFVEGYLTKMPVNKPINQTAAIAEILDLENQRSAFALPGVVVVSNRLWDYVSTHYIVKGKKITEDDLKNQATCRVFLDRLKIWRERLDAFQ